MQSNILFNAFLTLAFVVVVVALILVHSRVRSLIAHGFFGVPNQAFFLYFAESDKKKETSERALLPFCMELLRSLLFCMRTSRFSPFCAIFVGFYVQSRSVNNTRLFFFFKMIKRRETDTKSLDALCIHRNDETNTRQKSLYSFFFLSLLGSTFYLIHHAISCIRFWIVFI